MTEGSDVTRSAYDRWSVFYDQEPNPTVAVDEAHFPGVWRRLSGQRVLEIGCGTGRHTLRLARQGNEVVGIDLSLGMLTVARRTLRGHPVRLIHADFMTFDELAGGDFDAVIASLVLEHIEDTTAFFLRAARVLKRPARLYLSEIHPLRAATGSQARFVDPETGDERRPANFARTEDEVVRAAIGAGLRLSQSLDIVGDDDLTKIDADWRRYVGKPMIKIWVFDRS
jgi:2-polyprenyl-3-methyl-5-hydroxy-6-metoxy-1,4-benzoquinol methylase